MFRSHKLYVQISRNKVKVLDLATGAEATRSATEPFSSQRAVLSKFGPADATLREAMRELGIRPRFLSPIHMLIQQMEETGDGLTDIEKRALRDLAENAGASKVFIVEGERRLTIDEALAQIKGGSA